MTCPKTIAKRRALHLCINCGAPTSQKKNGKYYACCYRCRTAQKKYQEEHYKPKAKRVKPEQEKHGHLTVLAKGSVVSGQPQIYTCKCDCGRVVEVARQDIVYGGRQTCEDPDCPHFAATDPRGYEMAEEKELRWVCPAPDAHCAISSVCQMCCCECDKPCKSCLNTPEKCGAHMRVGVKGYYIPEKNAICWVDCCKVNSINAGRWRTYTRDVNGKSITLLKMIALQWQDKAADAQADLDALAAKKGWVEIRKKHHVWQISGREVNYVRRGTKSILAGE